MLPALETPTLKDFFKFLGLLLLYALLAYPLRKMFPVLKGTEFESALVDLIMLAALYPAARKAGFDFTRLRAYWNGLKAEARPALKYFLLMTALLFAADQVYTLLLAPWDLPWTNTLLFWNDQSHNPATLDPRLEALLAHPALLPAYVFGICAVAPAAEEFLLRRWLYVATRRYLPVAAALLANAALFGAMHGEDFMATGLAGLFFCWVYERTGRLETPVLVHCFTNLLAVVMLFSEKLFGFSL